MKNPARSANPLPVPKGRYEVTLRFTEEEAAYLERIASRLGQTRPEFVHAFIHDELPLQRLHRSLPGAITPETVAIDVRCETLAARLARAANFNEMSPGEWLLQSLARQLEAQEAQMIFDPHTGEVIGDARQIFQAIRL